MKYDRFTCLDADDIAWLKANCHLLPQMSAGKHSNVTYLSNEEIDSISGRNASDVYVNGSFEIAVVNTREAIGGPAFPHIQWIHGSSYKAIDNNRLKL